MLDMFIIIHNTRKSVLHIKHNEFLCFLTFQVFAVEFAGVPYTVISGYRNIHNLLIKHGAITSERNIGLMPPSYDIHDMKSRPGK